MKITHQPYYAKLAFTLLSIVLLYLILSHGSSVIIPVAFAFLTAIILHPAVRFLKNKAHFFDGMAIAVAVLTFLALLVGLIYLLSFQVVDFSNDFPVLRDKLLVWAGQAQRWAERNYHLTIKDQDAYINKVSGTVMSGAAATVGALVLGVGNFLFWTVIIFIYTFFILSYRRLLVRFVAALFPPEHRLSVKHSILESRVVVNSYVQGLLIEMIIVSVASCIGLSILGVRYALLLGLLTGVLNVIPYVGFITALVLSALVTLVHHSPTTTLIAAAVLFGIHLLDANVLAPRVIGGKVRMNPLATLIALMIGGMIWGIAGLFLAIPLSALVKIVFEHVELLKPWAMVMGTEADAPPEGELENEPTPLETEITETAELPITTEKTVTHKEA